MLIMPSEYVALQSRVKALETLVETLAENLEGRIIALEQNPAIQATKAIKQPIVGGFPVGYTWDNFKPCVAPNVSDMMWPWNVRNKGESK